MDRVEAAYELAGRALPWSGNAFQPFVPLSVNVRGVVAQPTLQFRNIATNDRVDRELDVRFRLVDDGNEPGLADTSVQVFFSTSGTARLGQDWEFAGPVRRGNGQNDFFDGVLRHGRDDEGNVVYSVMIESGAGGAELPIRILSDRRGEGAERLVLEIVEVDLWRDGARGPVLYQISGGPRDVESDFDGPAGAEALLIRDDTRAITIAEDLIA